MVRTGDRCVRVGGGKSSGKKGGGGSSSSSATPKSKASSSGRSNSSIGGNPVCPRDTPEWQKPITNFFQKKDPVESSNHPNKDSEPQGTSSSSDKSYDENVNKENGTPVKKMQTVKPDERVGISESKTVSDDVNDVDENMPSTSSSVVENNKKIEPSGSEDKCKTPTSDRKRKSSINILTPKRIPNHS